MKLIFIDVETTGFDPYKNGIHEISGIIEIDGKIEDTFKLSVAPFETDIIESSALDVSGVDESQVKKYSSPDKILSEIKSIFGRHIDKYDKKDKFFLLAYNSPFDDQFLRAFFKKNNDNYYGSWVRKDICVMRLAIDYLLDKEVVLGSYKQSEVAEYFGLADKNDKRWHDSSFDTEITRKIYRKIKGIK